MPTNPRRKSDAARRANQVVRSRTVLVMLLLGVLTFLLLFWKLYDLQINRHEELQGRAVNQQTLSAVVTASRGTIYDRGGYIMAASATAETVLLSPRDVAAFVRVRKKQMRKRRRRRRKGRDLYGAARAGSGVYCPRIEPDPAGGSGKNREVDGGHG